MRKGDVTKAFERCDKIVEQDFFLPPSGHLAMEVRTARAEITSNGNVIITTSSQSPYVVRQQIADAFRPEKFRCVFHLLEGDLEGKRPLCLRYWLI